MIELNEAENMLKSVYINTVANVLKNADKNPVRKKVICSGYGRTYVAPIEKRVGRNHLCPCGSGKKYKKCCMEAFE